MRIMIDPKAPIRLKVRYNGTEVFDQTLQPGAHDIDVAHPKTCGKAELFKVKDDGTEVPMGSADYGECECTPKCS